MVKKSSIKSVLEFKNYIVKNIDLKLNEDFDNEGEAISLDLNVGRQIEYIAIPEGTKILTGLNIKIFDKAKENNYPYELEVSIVGEFFTKNTNEAEVKLFAELNSVTILFPYLRALVSTITTNANLPTLVLPAINVNKLIGNNDDCDMELKH